MPQVAACVCRLFFFDALVTLPFTVRISKNEHQKNHLII
jgi:hypothetical protein